MYSVDMLPVTMIVASNKRKLLNPHVRPYPTCVVTFTSCHVKLRYFDWDGQVHLAKGKKGGKHGDPLEMLIFNLTTLQYGGVRLPSTRSWSREYTEGADGVRE